MTFVIKSTPEVGRAAVDRSPARGFTLLELLLVIGIIGLLAAILLPAVNRTYARAIALRTQADLQAVSSALEAYKSDFGAYPPITNINTGAAVLGKALLGPYDAAHYYTGSVGALVADNTLQNPPAAYASGRTYNAGDVVLSGGPPNFDVFAAGSQSTIYVCTRNETTTAPAAGGNFWWAVFLPYDGNDGPGVRPRLATAEGPNVAGTSVPHAAAGKVYGPYLDPERFKTNGPVILDRYGSPLLYFAVDRQANPALAGANPGWSNSVPYTATANRRAAINIDDNLGCFINATISPAEVAAPAVSRIRVMLGDYSNDGVYQAGPNDLPPPQGSYLLWAAGPDRVFGPRGRGLMAGDTFTRGDVYMTTTNADENRLSANACDDVTNFRP